MTKQIDHWHKGRTKNGMAGQGMAGQGRTGQDRAGQGRVIRMAMIKTKSMLEERCKHMFKQASKIVKSSLRE